MSVTSLTRIAQTAGVLLLSSVLVLGFSTSAHSSPTTGTIPAGLSGAGFKDIIAAGSKLFVLNGSDIKVIDTSVSTPTVSTITFSTPALDGTLNRAVYVEADQSVWITSYNMGTSGVVRNGGEVIRIDATTNTVTHRFCSRNSTGTCTLSADMEGLMGIATDGSNVYAVMAIAYEENRRTSVMIARNQADLAWALARANQVHHYRSELIATVLHGRWQAVFDCSSTSKYNFIFPINSAALR